MYPADLKYTKEHEWIRIDGDTGTVGITDFAQQQLGDVVYVDLPEVGATLTAGQPFGTIESVKAVSELFAPVSGEVVEVNARSQESPRARQLEAARDVDGQGPDVESRRGRSAARLGGLHTRSRARSQQQ